MKQRIIQGISIAFAGATGLIASLEFFLMNDVFGDRADRFSYFFMGIAAALFVVYYVIRGRLYKKADTWLVFSLFVYSFLVPLIYYGFSRSLFLLRTYYIWCILCFCFFAVRVSPKPESIIRAFSCMFVLATCVAGVYIIVHATQTLYGTVPDSLLLGCFRAGRLCGMTNANTMAFFCLTGILLSVYGFIRGKLPARIFYGCAIVILWFLMGLNNSRTANYALAFALAAFVFALVLRRLGKKGTTDGTTDGAQHVAQDGAQPVTQDVTQHETSDGAQDGTPNRTEKWTKKLARCAAALAAAGAAALCVVLLLMAPTPIYRATVAASAEASQAQQTQDDTELVYQRDLTDTETLGDRALVWKRSVELIFKSPRRTLLGISMRSTEPVNGSYEGRHDVTMPFAHTMLLEIFRRQGLIGLIIWLALLCIWGKYAITKLFDRKQDVGTVYLMAAAAGALLTGATESGPFVSLTAIAIPYAFFLCCGMAMREPEASASSPSQTVACASAG